MNPWVKRVLVASVAGSVVLGGAYVLLPPSGEKAAPPALGPAGRAMAAVGTGVPAALPDLAALIGEREAFVRTNPRDDHSWAVLGSAYVARGVRSSVVADFPKAETALNTSLRVRPQGNPEALTGLAALADARHDYRAAKKWGELAVRQAPKRWAAHAALIDAYSGLGDAKGVGRELESLQKLGSGSGSGSATTVRTLAGQVYRDRGWRENANAELVDAAALARSPAEKAACLHHVAELAWERGEPTESLRYDDAALAADSDHHPAMAGRGRALAALGRPSEALQAYRAAILRHPLPEYDLELGELYESLKLRPAARAQYDALRARVKQEAAGGVNNERILGLFEADHGDADAAVKRLTAEYKRHGSPQTADALGWALHRAGNDKAALKLATKAMEKGPRSALIAYHRGEIERELERYGAARRHIGEAMRVNPFFSPLAVPAAKRALEALGEPPEGGPEEMYASGPAAEITEVKPRRTPRRGQPQRRTTQRQSARGRGQTPRPRSSGSSGSSGSSSSSGSSGSN
ncbi:tetratricopeptide repeat protein [Streptomyces sp. NPDC005562]|uniref:tetratricopeptide repeat protein n=1 Tax=Streptomyces sp. NPDC005562 TaxID=3154890 RepID=UPI0033B63088